MAGMDSASISIQVHLPPDFRSSWFNAPLLSPQVTSNRRSPDRFWTCSVRSATFCRFFSDFEKRRSCHGMGRPATSEGEDSDKWLIPDRWTSTFRIDRS
jgi:hypothetical protein